MIRVFKATWYTITVRAREAGNKRLMQNPCAIRDAYEFIITYKQANIQRYKQAMGQLVAIREQKKNSLQRCNGEIDAMKDRITNILENRNKKTDELLETGISEQELPQHTDYIRLNDVYNDLVTTLEEKNGRVARLKRVIQRAEEDIELYKDEIGVLHRSVEKLKSEQTDAVADLITAREIQDIEEMVPSIKVD